jgi:peptidoglycan/xylan/chitin deacetylase (PgdA/CDA1 family)
MRLRDRLRALAKQALLCLGYPTAKLQRTDATLVLFYHDIGDDGITEREFEKQIRYLNRHFDLIFASEVSRPSTTGRLRVAVTFDDGLKNTRDVALPILRKFGVKATIFVLPGDIQWLWPAEIRERLRVALRQGIEISGQFLESGKDIDRIVQDLKTMPDDAFHIQVQKIRALTPFKPSYDWRASHELMTADELRALPRDLIEFGAHTIHHPILPKLDQPRLVREIVHVRGRLEALLGRPVKTFSYPNGDFDRRCLDLAERHYDFAFTTESAIGDYPDQAFIQGHRHAINRLHGSDLKADLPLLMHQFIEQGYGFVSKDESSTNPPVLNGMSDSAHQPSGPLAATPLQQ